MPEHISLERNVTALHIPIYFRRFQMHVCARPSWCFGPPTHTYWRGVRVGNFDSGTIRATTDRKIARTERLSYLRSEEVTTSGICCLATKLKAYVDDRVGRLNLPAPENKAHCGNASFHAPMAGIKGKQCSTPMGW